MFGHSFKIEKPKLFKMTVKMKKTYLIKRGYLHCGFLLTVNQWQMENYKQHKNHKVKISLRYNKLLVFFIVKIFSLFYCYRWNLIDFCGAPSQCNNTNPPLYNLTNMCVLYFAIFVSLQCLTIYTMVRFLYILIWPRNQIS